MVQVEDALDIAIEQQQLGQDVLAKIPDTFADMVQWALEGVPMDSWDGLLDGIAVLCTNRTSTL